MTNAKIVLSKITHFNWAKPFHASMGRVDAWQKACAIFLLCAATAIASSAQTFSTLFNFNGTNGAYPGVSSLVEGTDGNLYGTTQSGGSGFSCNSTVGCGTVFKITPGGTLTTLHSFCSSTHCPDGYDPYVGMVLGTDGNFYGTTAAGGTSSKCTVTGGCGTFFEITPEGMLSTLYSFCSQTSCADGIGPGGALVLGTDGNFYGTTTSGGVHNDGTVFNITPTGTLTTLHTFDGTDGIDPRGALALGTDGSFYGTTAAGGTGSRCTVTGGCGTVFEITPEGVLQTLYNFCSQTSCADGATPYGTVLIQATDGNFYGTTSGGGVPAGGTIFKITPQGALTTLYTFCDQSGCPDGAYPYAGLIQASDGNFYGTTYSFGANGVGALFSFPMEGMLTTLHSFVGGAPNQAYGQMVQATNGILYGTTNRGGTNNDGTVYSLSMAFVTLDPDAAEVGQTVDILGQVTGTTAVSFNGTAASFNVGSGGTYLTATVPSGATTGLVTVTTSSGTVTSNQPFLVTPQITSFSPPSGPVGTTVTITGVSLTQTTQVLFGGVPATTFIVNSDAQVRATVPTGAITGPITITTAGGTVVSSTIFHVDS